jgi:hypothetical protein
MGWVELGLVSAFGACMGKQTNLLAKHLYCLLFYHPKKNVRTLINLGGTLRVRGNNPWRISKWRSTMRTVPEANTKN